MDLKQIALFAWLPFLAADFGGVFGGFVAPFLMKTFGVTLVWSRIWGVVLGALMMIGPASIGLVSSPYTAIVLFCLGGFAHQTISVLVNTLSADLFDSREVGTVSGFAGMAAWTGGLGFRSDLRARPRLSEVHVAVKSPTACGDRPARSWRAWRFPPDANARATGTAR